MSDTTEQPSILDNLKTHSLEFSFTVPATHPEAGKKITKTFDYPQVENDEEALLVLAEKKWPLLGLVNDALKSNARSAAYQRSLLLYQPSNVPEEDIMERVRRDLIRLGLSEEEATEKTQAIIASKAK